MPMRRAANAGSRDSFGADLATENLVELVEVLNIPQNDAHVDDHFGVRRCVYPAFYRWGVCTAKQLQNP